MKKKLSLLVTSVLVFTTASGFSGCSKKKEKDSSKKYKVRSEEFFFSTDNGKHYGNGRLILLERSEDYAGS